MKKIIAMFLIIAMVFTGNVSVNAKEFNDNYIEDENIEIREITKGSAPSKFFSNPVDVLNSSLRSTSVPTRYWNLASSAYTGNLVEVRVNWLYTNYYFAPNSSGILYLDYNIRPVNTTGTQMQIGVYNISTGKFVKYYTTGGVPTAACIQIKGLNTDQHYALAFTAVRDPLPYNAVQGTIQVYH